MRGLASIIELALFGWSVQVDSVVRARQLVGDQLVGDMVSTSINYLSSLLHLHMAETRLQINLIPMCRRDIYKLDKNLS